MGMTTPGIQASAPDQLYARVAITPPDKPQVAPEATPRPAPAAQVVLAKTQTFGASPGRPQFESHFRQQTRVHRSVRAFEGRVLGAARQRLSDNRIRLDAAAMRLDKYGEGEWSGLRVQVQMQRDLAVQDQELTSQIRVLRASADELALTRFSGGGSQVKTWSREQDARADNLEVLLTEVRAHRMGLQQIDPVAAVIAESDVEAGASQSTLRTIVKQGFDEIRGAIVRADVGLQSGALDVMDLQVFVAERIQKEGLIAKASNRDAQAIVTSVAHHETQALALQVGGTLVVGGLSVAGLFVGGGVAIVGGLAGAGDAILNLRTAARMERVGLTGGAGGTPLVNGSAARLAFAMAWVDLAFSALDVVQVGSLVRGLADGYQLNKLFEAQELLTGLSAAQQHKLHVWVRQQATGQGAAASRSRRALEAEFGERFAEVERVFGRMLEGLSAGGVQALRGGLGEETFTKMAARFGGKKVQSWARNNGAAHVRRLSETLDPATTGALLDALDPRSLERLSSLDPKVLVELGGQLGLQKLNEVARHLDGAQLIRLKSAFGPNLEHVLGAQRLEDWADPGIVERLAQAPEAVLRGMLDNALRPKLAARLMQLTEGFDAVVRAPLRKYLSKAKPDEAAAAVQMLLLEARDGGHAIARHGPHISEAQLRKRLATAIAPDGVQGNGHWASTKFRSFRVMLRSRLAAFEGLKKVKNIDIRFGPGQGGNLPDPSYLITVEHGRDVSRGVFSAEAPVHLPKPGVGVEGQTFRSYRNAVDSTGYITRTQAKIVWEEGRWKVVQHFPGVEKLDRNARVYIEPAVVYLQAPR